MFCSLRLYQCYEAHYQEVNFLNLGFDLDGVLVDISSEIAKRASEECGLECIPEIDKYYTGDLNAPKEFKRYMASKFCDVDYLVTIDPNLEISANFTSVSDSLTRLLSSTVRGELWLPAVQMLR